MEDDCVVVEGSPLAEHLKSLGMQDCIERVEVEEPVTQGRPFMSLAWMLIEGVVKKWKCSPIQNCYQQLCINTLLKSDVLEEIDLEPIMMERNLQSGFMERSLRWCLLKRGIRDTVFALIPVVTVSLMPRQTIVTKILAFAPMVAILLRWRPVITMHCKYFQLKKYLEYTKCLHEDLRKASKLINEASLINKGYILNSRTAAFAWRLEVPHLLALSGLSEKSLPGLRIAVLHTTCRLAAEYCAELRMERKHRPLPYNLDHPALCLPLVEDLNDKNGENDESVPSLREIKKSMESCLIKQHEHFKRILFDLVSNESDDLHLTLSDNLVAKVLDSVKELRMAIALYRTVYSQKIKCKLQLSSGNKLTKRMSVLHSMCYSAKGHLEEALRGAISIEESLEELSTDPKHLSSLLTFWLNKIIFHVDSTKEFLMRAVVLVPETKLNESSLSDVVLPGNDKEPNILNDASEDKVEACAFPITDEVYELVGEKADSEDSVEDIWGGPAAELERESTQMVLQELKNVLHAKALDWERREKKLKEKTLGISVPMEDSMSKETDVIKPIEETEVRNNDWISSSSSMNNGDQTSCSMSSWVIPGVGEPAVMVGLDAAPQEEVTRFDSSIIGSLATEAVAKAKLNQAFGILMSSEEEFEVSGED